MSDSKLIRFFAKHPDTSRMSHTEFSQVKGSPQVTPAHFYKMRKRFHEEYEVEERPKAPGLKMEKIINYLQNLLEIESKAAVESLDYERFIEETKMEVSEEWFRRVSRKFLKRMNDVETEEAPSPISMNILLKDKIKELKELLAQFGYSNIRIIAVKKVDVEL